MSLESLITAYGYPALLAGTLLEGETALTLGGFFAHRGYLYLPWVVLVGFIGTFAGPQIFFHLGRWQGDVFFARRPHWQPQMARARRLLTEHHTAVVLGFRFLYGLRSLMPFLIGMSGIAPRQFAVLNALGAIVWTVAIVCAGYAFGQVIEALLSDVARYEKWILAGLVILGVTGWIVLRGWRRRLARRPPAERHG